MEKIININFHGRVIPIEETAYNTLKEYTDSLHRHFAGEEGSDEIINDIENRIAELLSAKLKQGAICITNTDLNTVIDSIGRIEDIRAADGDEGKQSQEQASTSGTTASSAGPQPQGRFVRNADDKVIAGVCSGIANRLALDPVVVRIIFVLLFGALFWIYILLWIIVPIQSIRSNTTRRLFRNPEGKVIAGVCSGLAVYFRTESWKVRLVFLAPLIISAVFRSMHIFTWHHAWGPGFFIGSFGSTFFILYIILWISLPYATSATERMELRGEKIDINSIAAASQARAGSGQQYSQPRSSGLGRAIGIIFKAFFLFVAGSLALGLFIALIGLVFAGTATMPYTSFFLDGYNHYALAWTAVTLTLGIPLLALIVWMIRRLMGVRSQRHYLGYVFAGLWIIGVICALIMAGTITRNFSTRGTIEEQLTIQQPSNGRMYVAVSNNQGPWHATRHNRWFGDWEDGNEDFHIVSKDSLWLNNVKVNLDQSPDSLFHVYMTRASRAVNAGQAKEIASHIAFELTQADTILYLPKGFTVSNKDKFRNQQVLVTVEVPLGKTVQVSPEVNDYSWYTISSHGNEVRYRSHYGGEDGWYAADRVYTMTASGLKRDVDTSKSKSWDDDNDD